MRERNERYEEGIAVAAASSVADFSPFSEAMKREDSLDLESDSPCGGSCCFCSWASISLDLWTPGLSVFLYSFYTDLTGVFFFLLWTEIHCNPSSALQQRGFLLRVPPTAP